MAPEKIPNIGDRKHLFVLDREVEHTTGERPWRGVAVTTSPLPVFDWSSDDVPDWSGKFLIWDSGEVAQVAIHDNDEWQSRPPPGWTLIDIEQVGSAEVHTYIRTPGA